MIEQDLLGVRDGDVVFIFDRRLPDLLFKIFVEIRGAQMAEGSQFGDS